MSTDPQFTTRVRNPIPRGYAAPVAIQAGLDPLTHCNFFDQASRKLRVAHRKQGIDLAGKIFRAIGTTGCLEFDARCRDGEAVRIRYVGHEQPARSTDAHCEGYRRDRITVAHRFLNWLETQHTDADWFPRVQLFDQDEGILVEGRGVQTSHTLLSELVDGTFDIDVASRLGTVIANLHSTPVIDSPLRANRRLERSWWQKRRQYWGERLDIQALQSLTKDDVLSDRHCMVHLDLDPQNILIQDGQVSLTAFECASSIGDPALDVTVVLENYRNSGTATGQQRAAEKAANAFLRAYQQRAGRCGVANKH